MRGGIGRAPLGEEVDAYDAAFLGGGGGRVISAALASLYGRGLIKFDEAHGNVTVQQTDRIPGALHETEWLVHKAIPQREPEELRSVSESLEPRMERLRDRLVDRGWVLAPEDVTRIKWIAALPFLALLFAGTMKLLIGVDRDKPVLFLFLLLIVTIIILATRLASLCKRTAEGQAVWRNLRASRHDLRNQLQHASVADTTAAMAMPMAVALLGTAAFATPGYEPLRKPLKRSGDGSGSGCGSSCGSSWSLSSGDSGSGCGGGGGDGGGGGGGCGGCGGGGGDCGASARLKNSKSQIPNFKMMPRFELQSGLKTW
jgi:uncharacterized protein (TIGR04222 family)